MAVYCDTNLLLRFFADLPESERVEHLMGGLRVADGPVPILWLHRIEIPNALQQLVLLARSGGPAHMTPENALLGLARFEDETTAGRHFAAASLPLEDVIRQARELSLRHTARYGFRAYDVAHVASALLLGCNRFWSFDAKANQLAALEGLKTL